MTAPKHASRARATLYNGRCRGETRNDIRFAAVRRSCSPRAPGRSAFIEVSR